VQESCAKVSEAWEGTRYKHALSWESTDGMQRIRSDIEGQIDNGLTDTQSE
jgi:hypothetical protein